MKNRKIGILIALIVAIVAVMPFTFSLADSSIWGSDGKYYPEGVEDGENYATGFTLVADTWYWFDMEGIKQTKTYGINDQDNDLFYYFDNNGAGKKYTGIYKDPDTNANLYYNEGVNKTSGYAVTADGVVYKCKADGTAEKFTGVYRNAFYYNGKLQTVKKKKQLVVMKDKNTYYVDASGKVYKPDKNGTYEMDNGKVYYIFGSGKVRVVEKAGAVKVNKKGYYFNDDSSIVTSGGKTRWMEIGDRTYRVNKQGQLLTGWRTINGKKYYTSTKKYFRLENQVTKINGYKYWFNKKGVMRTKVWKYKDGVRYYYFTKSGKALKSTSKYIGKYKFYFNKNSVAQTNLVKYKGLKWVRKHSIKIRVYRKLNIVTAYAKDGDRGYTIPVFNCICSTGKSSTPTPARTYTTGQVYRWKLLGGGANGPLCWGQYATWMSYRGYFFHSCTYDTQNIHTLDASQYNKLGQGASHGCVRLQAASARTIYQISDGKRCTVVVYDSDSKGPFGKPKIAKIPSSQNYDPTDPHL